MTQQLLLFSIGPVQSFIAQARKTHDLRVGSFLLSHLIDTTIDELENQVKECEIIFPYKEIESKPNRFMALFKSSNPKEVGDNLEKYIQKEFEEIAFSVLEKTGITKRDGFTKNLEEDFKNQITNFLQIFWTIIPFDKDNYSKSYLELEQSLGAIKNIRSFNQLEERGRKCSLCGERNVLFFREKRAFIPKHAIHFTSVSRTFFDDELCAVCFTKRFVNWHFNKKELQDYPSTAGIIFNNTLKKIDQKLKNDYKKILGKEFDAQLYFEENLTENYFERNDFPFSKLDEAKEQLKAIKKDAEKKGLSFPKYYSLIMFDGDSMGKWLSGAYLADKGQLQVFHNEMSKILGAFAKEVREIITEKEGRVIYAGGDDVLAFVNLEHLLPVLRKLREKFPNFGELSPKSDNVSTASCGICISHYKTPLGRTLSWARRMERQAKDKIAGKDAIGIAYLRRSGAITKSLFKWDYENTSTVESLKSFDSLNTLGTLKELVNLLQEEQFSSTFIRHLDEEFRRLMDKDGKYEEQIIGKNEEEKEEKLGLIKMEMQRLITRSCMMEKKEKESDKKFSERKRKEIEKLVERLNILYEKSFSLENFLAFLDIALLFERGIR
ncbi:MAG: type III-B CRISPR-associated protein Cas10/Cmr2 [Candidatus Heimdallarchaeota archaeon]|nr:type III-B CRISPR-associated protein Cas10/Cmr2 [Candidatus Heimdallarchaeota archaeon]